MVYSQIFMLDMLSNVPRANNGGIYPDTGGICCINILSPTRAKITLSIILPVIFYSILLKVSSHHHSDFLLFINQLYSEDMSKLRI